MRLMATVATMSLMTGVLSCGVVEEATVGHTPTSGITMHPTLQSMWHVDRLNMVMATPSTIVGGVVVVMVVEVEVVVVTV